MNFWPLLFQNLIERTHAIIINQRTIMSTFNRYTNRGTAENAVTIHHHSWCSSSMKLLANVETPSIMETNRTDREETRNCQKSGPE